MIITTSCAAQNANTLRQANRTHTIDKRINGGTVAVGDGSTLVFKKGGKITNATITGRNIRIVPNGNDVAFENCDFSRATIVNSSLQATNLGLVPNMTSKPYSYTFKGKRISTTLNQGTDNTRAWQQLAKLLSGSSGVKMTFNGSFYSGENVKKVEITDATNLELSGGTMIMGIKLRSCNNVNVHDMRWVGFQGVHDFPPIYTKNELTFNGVKYNSNNAFKLGTDRIVAMGLTDDALWIDIDADNKRSENITVQRCHFEMRQNGLVVGTTSTKRTVRNAKCIDCTASHIIYQPIGFHASNCLVDNMIAEYCLQGVDISTCSNNITVRNSRFTRCATGPKQESYGEYMSMTYNNVIDGCYFGINDDYLLLEGSQAILNVSEGAKGDVFTVRNTTFDIKKDRQFGSIRSRTNKVVFDNVTINVDNRLNSRSTDKWSMVEIFSIFGATSFAPQFELNNVTINLSSGTRVSAMCSPHSGGKVMNFNATGLKVNGPGTIDTYFSELNDVRLTRCSFNVPSTTVAKSVNALDASSCAIASTKCLFVNNNANATLRLKNNNIKSEKVVDFKTTPKLIDIQGNNIEMTGGEAFAGADSKASLSSRNFKVAGNTFTRKTSSAKVLPANSKSTKLLNNNVVK